MWLAQPGLGCPAGVFSFWSFVLFFGRFWSLSATCKVNLCFPTWHIWRWTPHFKGFAILLLFSLPKGSIREMRVNTGFLFSLKHSPHACSWNACSCLSPLAPCKVHFSCLCIQAFPWGLGSTGEVNGRVAQPAGCGVFLCTRLMFINHPGNGFCHWLHESF